MSCLSIVYYVARTLLSWSCVVSKTCPTHGHEFDMRVGQTCVFLRTCHLSSWRVHMSLAVSVQCIPTRNLGASRRVDVGLKRIVKIFNWTFSTWSTLHNWLHSDGNWVKVMIFYEAWSLKSESNSHVLHMLDTHSCSTHIKHIGVCVELR